MSPRPKPKAPRTPPEQLIREPDDIADYTGTLWRVHRTEGEHVLPWNKLRTYGPLPSMRWDPH
ncbi:MAG: RES domain-containing protein, partial [Mycobacterium sp.]